MADRPSYDFVYVHTDIPQGMTIREWRAHRAAEHAAERQAARAARRRRSVRRRAWVAGRAWLMALRHRRARVHGARA
jgi:hypothetical protein